MQVQDAEFMQITRGSQEERTLTTFRDINSDVRRAGALVIVERQPFNPRPHTKQWVRFCREFAGVAVADRDRGGVVPF